MKITDYLKIREAAKFLGVTANTLRNWEKEKKLFTYRNPINKYRLYKKEDLEKLLTNIKKENVMDLFTKQTIFSHNVAHLLEYLFKEGYQTTLGEAWRTPEQAQWDAQHGTGIINSLHCQRLAIDLNIFKDGKYLNDFKSYEPIGIYWESLDKDNRWGGRFKRVDLDHFEMNDK